jgi:hypothetical protein
MIVFVTVQITMALTALLYGYTGSKRDLLQDDGTVAARLTIRVQQAREHQKVGERRKNKSLDASFHG